MEMGGSGHTVLSPSRGEAPESGFAGLGNAGGTPAVLWGKGESESPSP